MARGDLATGLLMAALVIGGLLWYKSKNTAANAQSNVFGKTRVNWTTREGFQRQGLEHMAYASPNTFMHARDLIESRIGGPLFH